MRVLPKSPGWSARRHRSTRLLQRVPPRSVLTTEQKQALRLDPSIDNFFHPFKAVELWNGYSRSHQDEFLVGRIGIWFNLLNQGIKTTMIADTDTHENYNTRSGGARTWTPASSGHDVPASLLSSEIGEAVTAGRGVSGQGLYVQTRLLAKDGSGAVADFSRDGSTIVTSAAGGVDLEIRVQAPLWAEYDRIEVYANATPNLAGSNGGVPVAFGPGTPAVTLDLRVQAVQTNASLDPALFRVTIPDGATPISIDELRRVGPLAADASE